jgi:hypothetical protein
MGAWEPYIPPTSKAASCRGVQFSPKLDSLPVIAQSNWAPLTPAGSGPTWDPYFSHIVATWFWVKLFMVAPYKNDQIIPLQPFVPPAEAMVAVSTEEDDKTASPAFWK